jgi:N-acetylglucosamine-6-sulfatase
MSLGLSSGLLDFCGTSTKGASPVISCSVFRRGSWGRARTGAVTGVVVVASIVAAGGVHAVRSGRPQVEPARVVAPLPGDEPHGRTARGPLPPISGPARPNILVVMLDDMRSDEMRFAPNARRYIRERGLDFRNSFSPYPLCCPARASFLLGKYAHNHRVLYHEAPYGFGALDDHLTIAGRLQAAGYETALVGKYLNKYGDQPSRVTGRPSEHYVPAGWTDWMVGLETPFPAGSPKAGNTYNYFAFTQNINGRTVPHTGQYSSTVIGNEVRGLIGKYHRSDKPFFMWVTPVAPHIGDPVEPDDPPPYRESPAWLQRFPTPARPDWVKGRFDAEVTHAPGVPVHGPSEADVSDKPQNIRKWREMVPFEKQELRDVARQRAESIYAWDVEFGKIVERLKQTGEYDDTVIMFTSDNGYYLGEHRQREGKIKAHEPVLHVPLVVAGPGIEHGVRYHPITTLDLTATILDLAGARRLPAMDGASQLPVMTGPDRPWTVPVVTEGLITDVHRRPGSGVPPGLTTSGIRVGGYKLIRYANGDAELYDLMRDPNELTSVWSDPEYATVRRQLVDLWDNFRSCRKSACRVVMPESLQRSPDWLARQDRRARARHTAYYDD